MPEDARNGQPEMEISAIWQLICGIIIKVKLRVT